MNRLELLDYARFIAALCVVLFHYTYAGIYNGYVTEITLNSDLSSITKYGRFGVHFFFMISGYVIFYSAQRRTAREFAISRALKLYPLFLVALLFTTSFIFLFDDRDIKITVSQVLANLTMLPHMLGSTLIDTVYWTLELEIKFYVSVFFLILLGFQNKLRSVFLIWPWVILIFTLIDQNDFPYVGHLYCFFSAGAVFAILKKDKSLIPYLSLLVTYLLCVYDSTIILGAYENRDYSSITIAVIISFLFIFFFVLNSKFGSRLRLPKAFLLGAVTYPLYLVHAEVGYVIIAKWANEQNKFIMYFLAFLFCAGIAYSMHVLVEIKYHSIIKNLFQKGDKYVSVFIRSNKIFWSKEKNKHFP